MKLSSLSVVILLLCLSMNSYAIDYKKYKQYKARQQVSVLEHAKKAAIDWEFEKAEQLLKQAQNMAYAPDKISLVDALINQQRVAKTEKARKEREAEERRQRLARAQQQRDRQNSYNRSSASSMDYVLIDADCVTALCSASGLKISGGPGRFESGYGGASMGGIHKGYNGGLAGQYQWSVKIGRSSYCSGSLYISGTKRNYSLRLFPGSCSDGGSGEH